MRSSEKSNLTLIAPLAVLLLTLFANLSLAADIGTHKLVLTYSVNLQTCEEAAELVKTDKACRSFDAMNCSDKEARSIIVKGNQIRVFEELATNEYGYTQVFRAVAGSIKGYAIIYLNRFEGDKRPRLVETWKVDAEALNEVLKLPPGPIPYNRWINLNPVHPRETNAAEFASVLNRGEKVSDEWSPVMEIAGNPYLIERECSGLWVYGGDYACNKVIKLTVKKLAHDKKTIPYCQFTRPRKK